MLFKQFKDKSIQKAINKKLNSKKVAFKNESINSVGIILSLDEYHDNETFKTLLKEIGVNQNSIKIITFISDEKESDVNSWDSCFIQKDIGWKAKINNAELQRFVDTKFDLLISYYNDDNLCLNLVTAISKSNFKVGISNYDSRLNDLIISVKSKEIKVFKTEFIKYLKILNKI